MESVTFNGVNYPVKNYKSPNVSNTTHKKQGLVLHMTTSNNFGGTIEWFKNPAAKVSALFVVGREVGEIAMFNDVTKKFWHAGRISKPSQLFKNIAKLTGSGKYLNPNDYLDGIEFSGGVDKDKSGFVEQDEISLTDWQKECARAIIRWHANECEYQPDPSKVITHHDVASYKPDMRAVAQDIRDYAFAPLEEEFNCVFCDKMYAACKKIARIITNLFNTRNKTMKKELHPVLASSVNPEKVSMTIQGILIALVPVIIGILQAQDIAITENQLVEFIQNLTTVISTLLMVVGSLRKAWLSFRK